ncbi:MAG: hypothetical protein QN632_08635 [Nitrososphaeraceae archaeon]|jgi:hypothetical protein|nr:hypothetical protein [Nitrososphaeraceae archaeon]
MNWKDDYDNVLTIGDSVMVNGFIHVIEYVNIGGKNKARFIPKPPPNLLVEYHMMKYKDAQEYGIKKINAS